MASKEKLSRATVYRMVKLVLLIVASLYLWILFSAVLINDDYMALYTTWRMSLGDVANIDFNVDSYTLLFNLLAPIFALFGERIEVIYLYRLLMLLVLICITTQLQMILRPFVSRITSLITIFLLLLASPMYSRGLDIRPDLVILLIWLQIVLLLFRQTAREIAKMLLIGILIGIAFLLKFKSLIVLIPVAIYLLHTLHRGSHVSFFVRSVGMIVGGFLLALLLYAIVFGVLELTQLLLNSAELIWLSASGGIKTPGLKPNILKHFFSKDIYYWLLFFFGTGIAVKGFRFYSSEDLLKLVSLFSLLTCSLLINPHFYAYNLVTLYPLMAVFVALSLQWISEKLGNMPTNKSGFYIAAIMLLLVQPIAGIASHPLRNSMDYQLELQRFIQDNTSPDQAVFAYEGIGLFRPSTYHWRTSGIMLKNYHNGEYNVWREIVETKPILVILSYRLPNWLMEEDQQQLKSHYTVIAPYVMTLGFETDSSTSGGLLKSGLYQVLNSDGQSCELDGLEVKNQSVHWLDSGIHTLKIRKGRSILSWYFSRESLDRLVKSNYNRYPYLLAPK